MGYALEHTSLKLLTRMCNYEKEGLNNFFCWAKLNHRTLLSTPPPIWKLLSASQPAQFTLFQCSSSRARSHN
jgi:hypothetical protein